MKVYVFSKDYKGEKEIENSLEALQEFVGGYIEVISLGENVVLICDDEGKIKQKEPTLFLNFKNGTEVIVGNCSICNVKGEEFDSLTEGQIEGINSDIDVQFFRTLNI